MKLPLLSLLLCGLMLSSASAVTVVWQGGVGNLTDANWNVDGTPNQTTSFFGDTVTEFSVTINGGTVNGFNDATTGAARTGDTLLITGGASIVGDFLRPFPSQAVNYISLQEGNITMTDANAFRSLSGGFTGQINFTGTAGLATVVQTNLTGSVSQELAGKISAAGGTASFFSIDGTNIISTVAYDGTNLAAVNAELASLAINNKYFEITENAGAQTLHLRAIPEPSAAILAGLGSLLLLRRRR